ncbi:3,4-dihydroxyphenylacetate 2,3-dioxygenase [Sulfobacillus thermotolerans]|uniref:3,4-dihydroxyphenylacetate 2,3-dioxygenase n=1 Tax=Sulfobacillus thermotolerans TaxID=338644 RepID=A0ABN5H234_9FIRM|nr:3,4-dihydroxyphenylacetate 2,3-dioxygenase [Sulfobacillus thermotolerans]
MSTTPQIIRTAHIEYRVTDLERARAFYVDTIGFVVTEATPDALYLRGLEDRNHHCLILRRADSPGIGHVAFQVRGAADLDILERLYQPTARYFQRVPAGTEHGIGEALRIQDQWGFPLEFFWESAKAPWMLQRYDQYHGFDVMRLDHVSFIVSEIDPAYQWYTNTLGFGCSEMTVTSDTPPIKWGAWLHRKQTSHDLALQIGVGTPMIHHASFISGSVPSLLRGLDVLGAQGYHRRVERGPGRHGTTNAFFLYLRDPDGNRLELFTGDYLLADPDWDPIIWSLEDEQRQTFWGADAPDSWFNEAMTVTDWQTGLPLPTTGSAVQTQPTYLNSRR